MDVSAKFGYTHGCVVRTGALRKDRFNKNKKRYGLLFLWLLAFGSSKESDSPRGETSAKKVEIQTG